MAPENWSMQDAREFLDRFESSCATAGIEGERDPRCLPFHVFKSDDGIRLFEVEDRRSFDQRYGVASSRIDDERRVWNLEPGRFHGQNVLHVAGVELRAGYHWDVMPERGYTIVMTTTEIWKVEEYVNVSPDAHIRGSPPDAKRVYPRQK